MNIQCRKCAHTYALDSERDIMNVYVTEPEHSHVLTKCPACGIVMRLFIDPGQVQQLEEGCEVRMVFFSDPAPKGVATLAQLARKGATVKEVKELEVAIPREWLVELLDTLREFGGHCTDECSHFKVVAERP